MRELNVEELSLVAGAYSRGAIVYRVEPAPIDSSGGLNIADLYTRLAEICARNGGVFSTNTSQGALSGGVFGRVVGSTDVNGQHSNFTCTLPHDVHSKK
ncbi:hypothetical protein [Xylella fastidiosa]|uniref:hypothetical protein n=1 Tax=Xylella fastidiosa TaxID=2371 RepID=UPI000AE20E35|nr:hypothetical protein [Xylella fastidiosa]TNW25409.1 hypothetical protein EIP74_02675 [Xylella fastidiosa subsp. pauca]